MRLSELSCGVRVRVRRVCAPEPLLSHLLARGITPGAPVEVLFRAPFGSPRAYRVRGTVLALGQEAAEKIELAGDSGADLWYDGENRREAHLHGRSTAGPAAVGAEGRRDASHPRPKGAGSAYHPL